VEEEPDEEQLRTLWAGGISEKVSIILNGTSVVFYSVLRIPILDPVPFSSRDLE
jgi:hypothetical protein